LSGPLANWDFLLARSEAKKSSGVGAQLEQVTDVDESMPVDVLELGLGTLGCVEFNKRATRRFKIALSWLCSSELSTQSSLNAGLTIAANYS